MKHLTPITDPYQRDQNGGGLNADWRFVNAD